MTSLNWTTLKPTKPGTYAFYGDLNGKKGTYTRQRVVVDDKDLDSLPPGLWAKLDDLPEMTNEQIRILDIMYSVDMQSIKSELETAEWYHDADADREARSIVLGTVMSMTPSGKYYQPFACANVEPCRRCDGSGTIKNAVISYGMYGAAKSFATSMRLMARAAYGSELDFSTWPEPIVKAMQALEDMAEKLAPRIACPDCQGTGSVEAFLDEEWWSVMEDLFEDAGLSISCSPDCSTDILVTEYRDIPIKEGPSGRQEE